MVPSIFCLENFSWDLDVAHPRLARCSDEMQFVFALAHLPAWQVPRQWWLVRAIRSNARGKVARAELREKYLERLKRERVKGEKAHRFVI